MICSAVRSGRNHAARFQTEPGRCAYSGGAEELPEEVENRLEERWNGSRRRLDRRVSPSVKAGTTVGVAAGVDVGLVDWGHRGCRPRCALQPRVAGQCEAQPREHGHRLYFPDRSRSRQTVPAVPPGRSSQGPIQRRDRRGTRRASTGRGPRRWRPGSLPGRARNTPSLPARNPLRPAGDRLAAPRIVGTGPGCSRPARKRASSRARVA